MGAATERQFFEYIGRVYVRPNGRGILLLDLPHGSNYGMVELDPEHGYYRAVLRFVPIPAAPDRPWHPEPE